ncbi:hypothetical protein ACHAXR_005916 [Thalassiosira sp. AJA248-18]
MTETNASQGLTTPLMQTLLTSGASDDDGDRYDVALGSAAHKISSRTLTAGCIFDESTRASSAATAGAKSTSQQPEPQLTSFVLAVILFFNAGGGPFGVEPSLKAAGNLYAIIGFAAMPLVWALPEAVMTYELSSLYPCASGGVRWTEEAFGEAWGLLVGYLGWVSGVTYSASLPVLFLSYVHNQFLPEISDTESNAFLHYGILAGITLLLAFVNYRGLDIVGKASVLIFFVSMVPFVLMVIIGIPKGKFFVAIFYRHKRYCSSFDPNKWLQTPDGEVEIFDDDALSQKGWFPGAYPAGIAFRPFINNLYWNFNGFDQGGHFSTVSSKNALRNGIFGSLLLVSSSYLLPILITTGATDIKQEEWAEGSFANAATEIGGRWLGNWIVVSSGISLLAQFFSGMSADTMQMLGMADRGQLPSIFRHRSPHDTPTYGLVLSVLVILAMLPLPFGIIVELSNFAFCLSVIVEFLAFAKLRIHNGDCSKLRKAFYLILLIAPMLFNIAVILLASYSTYIFGACLTVFGVLLIYAKRISLDYCSCCWGRDANENDGAAIKF